MRAVASRARVLSAASPARARSCPCPREMPAVADVNGFPLLLGGVPEGAERQLTRRRLDEYASITPISLDDDECVSRFPSLHFCVLFSRVSPRRALVCFEFCYVVSSLSLSLARPPSVTFGDRYVWRPLRLATAVRKRTICVACLARFAICSPQVREQRRDLRQQRLVLDELHGRRQRARRERGRGRGRANERVVVVRPPLAGGACARLARGAGGGAAAVRALRGGRRRERRAVCAQGIPPAPDGRRRLARTRGAATTSHTFFVVARYGLSGVLTHEERNRHVSCWPRLTTRK